MQMKGTQGIIREKLYKTIDEKQSLQAPEVIKKSKELDTKIFNSTIADGCLKLIDYVGCIEMATNYLGPDRPNIDALRRILLRFKGEQL